MANLKMNETGVSEFLSMKHTSRLSEDLQPYHVLAME